MDTAEYNGARIRLSKVNQHMSYWKLLLILLWLLSTWSDLADANDQSGQVTCYTGANCDITWTDDVPPFIVVQWYFNDTQIAQTYNESLSQDTLIINKNYMGRFRLNRTDSVGFNIKGVKENDTGEYKCLVTLQGTGDVNVRKCLLKVEGYNGTKIQSDEVERSTRSGEEEHPPVSDSPGTANPAVVVPVVIAVIAVVAVVVAFVVIRKKRKSTGENQNVRSEEKPVSESHELLEQEIKPPDQQRCTDALHSDKLDPTALGQLATYTYFYMQMIGANPEIT
ncbi:uncharacterized protein LOC124256699 isoform X2 [Haliotis rubra]|uniref:uncharacterized protein LOC124256699 isoform X2 n=1 Tax=Haliotis rubra TaxID=36100 RepID=UPI001EE618F0|nr:uncharacterized protein LOC124256699 isoform X2 [Haliotis rubra]